MKEELEHRNVGMSLEEALSKCINCLSVEVFAQKDMGWVRAEDACMQGIKQRLDKDEVIYQEGPTFVRVLNSYRYYFPDKYLIGKYCYDNG